MPSFIDSVEKPEDIWHLTNYILSLGPDSPHYATLLTVTAVSGAIPDDPNADFWKKLTPNNVPLMGQVIVDPRNFNPAIDLVSVRAAYNDKEVAFHLTWDDPTESKGAAEASANGPAKIGPLAGGEIGGTAVFVNGQYRLVIKRPLAAKGEGRPSFRPTVFTPVAFQAWDGGAGETGPKMSLTSWYYLRLEEPQSNRRFIIPPVVVILTL